MTEMPLTYYTTHVAMTDIIKRYIIKGLPGWLVAVCFVFATWYHVAAQKLPDMQIPDFTEIKKAVNDPASPFYYPNLVRKYNAKDTTMTHEEFRYYYLGYIFQEDYNPYRKSEYSHQLDRLYKQTQHSVGECENIVKFALLTLADDPFDLRQMNFLIYALKEQNKYKEAAIWEFRMNHLIQAILSTGDGKAPETAWYVISPVHEYNILNRLGLTGKDFVFVEPYYDYVEVDKNPLKIEGYYFNVHHILDVFDRKYRYEE